MRRFPDRSAYKENLTSGNGTKGRRHLSTIIEQMPDRLVDLLRRQVHGSIQVR
jgi:hypothetical protein